MEREIDKEIDTKNSSYSNYQMLQERIQKLKKQKNAILLVHNYQREEIQIIGDIIGDSLDLARKGRDVDNKLIIFCGVNFMAETVKILSPSKKVVLPVKDAACPMANMITAEDVKQLRNKHPEAMVVCYVNTTAAVKAECDVCCTSANAVSVVNSLPADKVVFVPDKNLGSYIQRFTKKQMVLWDGYCYVHNAISPDEIGEAKMIHPDAKVVVHPECTPQVIDLADFVESTTGMVKLPQKTDYKKFLIGTEEGLIKRLRRENPDKEFYSAGMTRTCFNMKKITLETILTALEKEEIEINIAPDTINSARKALDKMLEYI